MTKEQAIKELKSLSPSAEAIETVLSLMKDQADRINYLENNRKQVKEQVEAAQLELSFAIDMLTDI